MRSLDGDPAMEQHAQAMRKYNAKVKGVAPQHTIDEQQITDLRHAFAHGRLILEAPGKPLWLFKFGKKKGGKVALTFAERLTPDWFRAQTEHIFGEMKKVMIARIEFEEAATGRHVVGR